MTMPNSRADRELDKFVEDGSGKTAINTVGSLTIDLDKATNPVIANLTSPAIIDTEFSHTIPDGAKKIMFRVREKKEMQFGFVTGLADYITLPSGASYSVDNISMTGKTLYMKTGYSSLTVELLIWT